MDILCVGMLRSCSTWQYEIAGHLAEHHLGGKRLGYLEGPEYAKLPPARPEIWRVVKAHHRHPAFRERLEEGTAVALYSFRDVRDVTISLAHKLSVDFGTLMAEGRPRELLEDDAFWRGCPNVLLQRYEEIVARPVSSVQEIAGRLGLILSTSEAASLASEYSFESNRKRTQTLERRLRSKGVDLSDPRNAIRHDPKTLLHWNHLRSGRVGAWREEATMEQREAMARLFGPWLAANGYEEDDFRVETAGLGVAVSGERGARDVTGRAALAVRALLSIRETIGRWFSVEADRRTY